MERAGTDTCARTRMMTRTTREMGKGDEPGTEMSISY